MMAQESTINMEKDCLEVENKSYIDQQKYTMHVGTRENRLQINIDNSMNS